MRCQHGRTKHINQIDTPILLVTGDTTWPLFVFLAELEGTRREEEPEPAPEQPEEEWRWSRGFCVLLCILRMWYTSLRTRPAGTRCIALYFTGWGLACLRVYRGWICTATCDVIHFVIAKATRCSQIRWSIFYSHIHRELCQMFIHGLARSMTVEL